MAEPNPFRMSRVDPFAASNTHASSFSSGRQEPTATSSAPRPVHQREASDFGASPNPNSDAGAFAAAAKRRSTQPRDVAPALAPVDLDGHPLDSYPSNESGQSHSREDSYSDPQISTANAVYAARPEFGRRVPSEAGSAMSNGRSAARYPSSVRSGLSQTGNRKSFNSVRSGGTTNRKAFVSTRLKGEIYKPWLEKPDRAQAWARWITIGCIFLGFAIIGLLAWSGYASVPHIGKLCMVLEDNFDTLDTDIWKREVQVGGFGNGEFDWTTDSDKNSFVEDNVLYIVPTLTSDVLSTDQITNGYTLELGDSCTAANITGPSCVQTSNSSLGQIISPVQSARLTTKLSRSIRYGKITFDARMPTGNWMWPSIWMLPNDEYYGAWPTSGEIDIISGRGNDADYPDRGVNFVTSALHWGPFKTLDRYYWTWGYNQQRRRYYNDGFRSFGMEWTEDYLWTWVGSKVNKILALDFTKKDFFERGQFPAVVANNSEQITLTNPWIKSDNNSAPFDRSFYMILNVAVGGTNGWFPDGDGGKVWVDSATTAPFDFYNATDKWYSTWPDDPKKRGMAIKNFKMWQKC